MSFPGGIDGPAPGRRNAPPCSRSAAMDAVGRLERAVLALVEGFEREWWDLTVRKIRVVRKSRRAVAIRMGVELRRCPLPGSGAS